MEKLKKKVIVKDTTAPVYSVNGYNDDYGIFCRCTGKSRV